MIAYSVILIGLASMYCVAILRVTYGFRLLCEEQRSPSPTRPSLESAPFVSVVIPARNEASNIHSCLRSVFANDYGNFEAIIVDDGSDDDTAARAESFARSQQLDGRLSVVRLTDSEDQIRTGHKKRALEAGINESRGRLIVTTDADTRVPPGWLSTLVSCFDDEVDLVAAPVAYSERPRFIEKALALELLGLVAVGAGSIRIGQPNMCNGANLAYRRSAFDRVQGFRGIDHLSTGDDTMLMMKIWSADRGNVRFCTHMESLVTTRPESGWQNILSQRRRWASKGLKTGNATARSLAILVYAFHITLLAALLAVPWISGLWPAVALAVFLKLAAEGLLLASSCRQFERLHLMRVFLPAQILQIPYVVIVGFLAVFGSGFSWKQRRLER